MRVVVVETASGAVANVVLLEGFDLAADGKSATAAVAHPEGNYQAAMDAPAGCVFMASEVAGPGWTWSKDGGFSPPLAAVAAERADLASDIDRQAESRRLRHVTGGAGQAMVYLQKQTQAAQALAAAQASPAMTADQGAAAFALLAAEVGMTLDPSTGTPAADVFGVARAVAAAVGRWLPLAAKIEAARLGAKAAIVATTTAEAARAAHAAVAWPD